MRNKPYPLNKVPQTNNLKEFALYCASTYKDRIAFQFEQDSDISKVSFQELLDDINALGTALHHLGLQGAKIALIGENSYQWILSYFAIVNGGNVVVPLDMETPEDDLAALLINTEISCVICSEKCFVKVQRIKRSFNFQLLYVFEKDISNLVLHGKELVKKGERSFIDYTVQDDLCSAILYTSGTTSKPKGVMLSHKNIAADAVVSIRNVFFAGTSILVLPLYHTFSFTASVLCVMLSGRTISINRNLKELKSDFEKYQPQNLVLVPMIVESLYKQIWIQAKKKNKDKTLRKFIAISIALLKIKIDLRRILFSSVCKSFGGKLEFIISGGAPLQDKYVKGFRELGIQVLNGYGITECSPVLSVNRNHHFRDHSVGQVLDGIDIKIVDDEILVKGDIVTLGYYKDESQTDKAFDNEWFKTGDLGYLDDDGFLYITGRKKNLIILSNGKNISPEELEEHLYKLDYVKEVVVSQNGNQIEAELYFADENAELYRQKIEKDLEIINSTLPIYKNISKVIIRGTEFPKTSTKKIRRTNR
ncbi:MAG: AMP-binding protein [Eubacteriales bacterium]|nr:AMP-binding protein [Eubacteriales bacterium]